MALSVCNPISTDAKGRELIQHGTALFPVACYHDDLHQFEVAWHWHEELEVFTAEEGTARVSVNGADHIIRQGEGVFINTGILHGVWQEGDSACRLRSMVFHPRFVGGSVDSILWQKYLEPLLGDPSCPCFKIALLLKRSPPKRICGTGSGPKPCSNTSRHTSARKSPWRKSPGAPISARANACGVSEASLSAPQCNM